MLVVYTHPRPRPAESIDLATVPLEDLASTVEDIVHHQTSAHLWFGLLDGWMLTPIDEVRIRPALRKFTCSLITQFPVALSLAWKNEIQTIYTTNPNGDPDVNHDGRVVHDGSSTGHRHFGPSTSADGPAHQN